MEQRRQAVVLLAVLPAEHGRDEGLELQQGGGLALDLVLAELTHRPLSLVRAAELVWVLRSAWSCSGTAAAAACCPRPRRR
ncbi:hypothetical protein OHV05_38045 (plasmid) [Kitasatospora sp. NBC_00070]|uniref:hypothetical protein n=1 Tax=Kitasatospora sp. NBC_00070 TaxID=2975962 RepID=UPI002F91444D